MRIGLICIVVLVSAFSGATMQMVNGNPKFDRLEEVPAGYEQYIHASDADLQWWKDVKFGVFMHWDAPSSLNFSEISWGYGGPRPGHPFVQKNTKAVSAEDYHSSYTRFNPVQFNADEWATKIKDSGAGYLVFTAKHHGGFCMFDSKYTEYDIMSTPFKRDICGELVKAWIKTGHAAKLVSFNPDIIILKLGTNDSKKAHWVNKANFEPDLKTFIYEFRQRNPEVQIFLCLPAPAFDRKTRNISDGESISGLRILNEVIPIIKRVAREERVHLIDLNAPLVNHQEYFPDGVHPDKAGAEALAELVYRALARALK